MLVGQAWEWLDGGSMGGGLFQWSLVPHKYVDGHVLQDSRVQQRVI